MMMTVVVVVVVVVEAAAAVAAAAILKKSLYGKQTMGIVWMFYRGYLYGICVCLM
jgi:hypothetical protein